MNAPQQLPALCIVSVVKGSDSDFYRVTAEGKRRATLLGSIALVSRDDAEARIRELEGALESIDKAATDDPACEIDSPTWLAISAARKALEGEKL